MTRLGHVWRALEHEQRRAALASLGLFISMLLPWYQQNAVVNAPRTAPLQSRNLNAFQVFSFVEAAVLLVAVAVAYLLYARTEGRDFRLPGGDGGVVLAAGLWAAALLVLRLFDKPGISSRGVAGNVGVQWGIFFALAAAGLLAYTGGRMRAGERPQPPLARGGAQQRKPDPDGKVTHLQDRPEHEGAESRFEGEKTTLPATQAGSKWSTPVPADRRPARGRPRYPPAPAEQMSLEDPPPGSD